VIAMVTRTGWRTSKGQLIRCILSVKPIVCEYDREARIFLTFLILVGCGFCFVSLSIWGVYYEDTFIAINILYGLEANHDCSALLPSLFHMGVLMSANSLRKEHKIYTSHPSRIPISAKIHVMCFDKTGTLTKDDLDMIGVMPISEKKNSQKI